MSSWYAVHTQPNGEVKAMQHLLRQGFDVFLPKYLKRRSHARKIDWVPAPLFPRYLFVGMDIAENRWRAIHSTVGVSYLVCQGDSPVEVPDDVVSSLWAREDAKGLIDFAQISPFKRGDKLQILDAAFGDVIGEFENLDEQGRVTLLLDLMGRKVKLKTPLEKVTAVG